MFHHVSSVFSFACWKSCWTFEFRPKMDDSDEVNGSPNDDRMAPNWPVPLIPNLEPSILRLASMSRCNRQCHAPHLQISIDWTGASNVEFRPVGFRCSSRLVCPIWWWRFSLFNIWFKRDCTLENLDFSWVWLKLSLSIPRGWNLVNGFLLFRRWRKMMLLLATYSSLFQKRWSPRSAWRRHEFREICLFSSHALKPLFLSVKKDALQQAFQKPPGSGPILVDQAWLKTLPALCLSFGRWTPEDATSCGALFLSVLLMNTYPTVGKRLEAMLSRPRFPDATPKNISGQVVSPKT